MRIFAGLLTAAACGFLYGLCFPPLACWWLSWVVLVPAFVAMRRALFWQALAIAAVLASAGAVATVSWLPRSVTVYFHQPAWVGALLFSAVTLVMVVPSYVAFAACYKAFSLRPTAGLPLLAAAAWVAGEFARSHLLTGNPWVLFGYSQAHVAPVVQLADLTGVYGISFVLVVVTTALAECWVVWRERGGLTRAATRGLLVALAVVLLTLAYGWSHLLSDDSTSQPQAAVKVAVVQGNLDIGSQWRTEFYGKNLDTYLRMTADVLRRSQARLVVWPETAMTFFLEREPTYQATIGSFLQPWDAQLLAGGARVTESADTRYYNTVYAITPQGTILDRYDKQRLLPFAEYSPLRRFDLLRRDFGRVREFTPGASSLPLSTVAGRAGVLVCNEAYFPEIARARVRSGATYLVNVTNDTWVTDPTFSLIAFDMSVVRAVEERRYLVRASTAGPSAIVDPLGRVVVQTPLFAPAVCDAPLHATTTLTVYARLGDTFVVLCVLLASSALAMRWLSLRSPD